MRLSWLLAVLLAATPRAALSQTAPTEVMVIGTYHFANHNLDLHNVKSDDVLSPGRQKELTALAERIAAWKPNKIMVEVIPPAAGQRLTGPNGEYDPALLKTSREEWVQIGFRVAGFVAYAPVKTPVFSLDVFRVTRSCFADRSTYAFTSAR